MNYRCYDWQPHRTVDPDGYGSGINTSGDWEDDCATCSKHALNKWIENGYADTGLTRKRCYYCEKRAWGISLKWRYDVGFSMATPGSTFCGVPKMPVRAEQPKGICYCDDDNLNSEVHYTCRHNPKKNWNYAFEGPREEEKMVIRGIPEGMPREAACHMCSRYATGYTAGFLDAGGVKPNEKNTICFQCVNTGDDNGKTTATLYRHMNMGKRSDGYSQKCVHWDSAAVLARLDGVVDMSDAVETTVQSSVSRMWIALSVGFVLIGIVGGGALALKKATGKLQTVDETTPVA